MARLLLALLLVSLATFVYSATLSVMVGQGGNTFTPQNTTCKPGDMVVFTWAAGNHSLIRSDAPAGSCAPSTSIQSPALQPPTNVVGTNVTFNCTSSTPPTVWFYCGVQQHCQGGMWGVIKLEGGSNSTTPSPSSGPKSPSDGPSGSQPAATDKASSANKGEISAALIIGSGLLMYFAGLFL